MTRNKVEDVTVSGLEGISFEWNCSVGCCRREGWFEYNVCILDCLQYTDTTHKISLKNCKNLFASGDGIYLLDAHIIYDHHRRQVSHRYDYFVCRYAESTLFHFSCFLYSYEAGDVGWLKACWHPADWWGVMGDHLFRWFAKIGCWPSSPSKTTRGSPFINAISCMCMCVEGVCVCKCFPRWFGQTF